MYTRSTPIPHIVFISANLCARGCHNIISDMKSTQLLDNSKEVVHGAQLGGQY